MDRALRIAGAGIACMDYIFASPKVRWGDCAIVSDYQMQGGGLVGTAMVACARLGAHCDILTPLGDDPTGDQIAEELQDEGVSNTTALRQVGGKSPFSFIHVDEQTGERTIFHRPGSGLIDSETPIDVTPVSSAQALLVDDIYLELSLAAVREARSSGVPVVADLIPNSRNEELLRHVDVLIAPSHFARDLGYADDGFKALERIHELGPSTAVITLGSKGWIYSDASGTGRGDAFSIDVVDTTGAGDSFHGAFTYGLAQSWDIRRCAEFASAVAAIKCCKPGGRTGLPSLAQTLDFLRERSSLEW